MRRPAAILLTVALTSTLLGACTQSGGQVTQSNVNAPAEGFGTYRDVRNGEDRRGPID